MDSLLFTECASVLIDHAHLFPTETSVLDRHTKEQVFVLLVIGGKGVLVEQPQFRVIPTGFHEIGKLKFGWSRLGGTLVSCARHRSSC